MSVRVSMPAIMNQAGRKFNVDKMDGVSRRHTQNTRSEGRRRGRRAVRWRTAS